VLRNPPFKRAFWGKSDLGQGRPPNKDRGYFGTYPSKGHSGGSPITDRDAPPDGDRGCLRTHPSKGHYRGGLISDRDAPFDKDKAGLRHPPFKMVFWGKSDLRQVRPP